MDARQAKRVVGVLAGVLLVAANSQASVCTNWALNNAMTTGDMTFGSPATPANDCRWSPKGDNQPNHHATGVNSLWQLGGDPFVFLAKWDVGTPSAPTIGSAFGFNWRLASIPSGTSGNYTLTATATATALTSPPSGAVTLPYIFDFVGLLKGGPGFGTWFFNDRVFNPVVPATDPVTGTGGGTWTINFRTGGGSNGLGNIPDLSHLSIFARAVGSPPPPPNGVPTPGTLPLVGLALLAGWVAARRWSERRPDAAQTSAASACARSACRSSTASSPIAGRTRVPGSRERSSPRLRRFFLHTKPVATADNDMRTDFTSVLFTNTAYTKL